VGISVKCRSRSTGTESTHVRIDRGDFNKMRVACDAFDCVPFFAIVVDAASTICGFILSMEHLLKLHPLGKTSSSWSMRPGWLKRYENDREIMRFVFTTKTTRWWNGVGRGKR